METIEKRRRKRERGREADTANTEKRGRDGNIEKRGRGIER